MSVHENEPGAGRSVVDEQPVRQQWWLGSYRSFRRDRTWGHVACARGGFPGRGQLGDRVHSQGCSIMARVEDRFGDLDVEHVATARFGNRVAGGSLILRCTRRTERPSAGSPRLFGPTYSLVPSVKKCERPQPAPAEQLRQKRKHAYFSF